MSVGHYENFPVASLLLPARLREAVTVIYRFARSADDFADEGNDVPAARLAKLQAYRRKLLTVSTGGKPEDALFSDIARIAEQHALPLEPFADLLDAFSQDVSKVRYADFGELLDYCRRSANPVGRLLLHLFKRTNDSALERSDAICSALQLINFLQDVTIDYAKGRIYIPQDEMAAYGVTEAHLRKQVCDSAWQALMAFQVARARSLLLSGASLGRTLPGRVGLEIRATVQGGLRILDKIEKEGYDMFRRRPTLGGADWPLLLLKAL